VLETARGNADARATVTLGLSCCQRELRHSSDTPAEDLHGRKSSTAVQQDQWVAGAYYQRLQAIEQRAEQENPPAFGYGAPHLSARGTSTLQDNALLGARFAYSALASFRMGMVVSASCRV
jgi:hypothetical protein